MKKQKICFDTSAVCSLFDNSHNTSVVARMFDYLDRNSNSFQLVVSPVFSYEIKYAPEQLIEKTDKIIETYHITRLPESNTTIDTVADLVNIYINNQVLTAKHYQDLAHLAYAGIFSCNFFVTCDKKHLARQNTIDLVQKINTEQNIFVPQIVTPSIFMEIQK
ncbi:MAG: hypothetical protein LBU34_12015 [Planctomycetaceae bacterium]|jgi:predicted nucleic acid-binding protein|nr:hypothetical protein [Planctomycetaceae bacterium]